MGNVKPDNEGFITFSEFRAFMFENIVPVEDIIDHKGKPISTILPFWRKNELIPFIPKGKHLKISFAELIWLRILDSLRQFSYPIEQTLKICHYFFKDAYDDELPKRNMKYNQEILWKKRQAGTLTDEDALMLTYLEDFLNDDGILYWLKTDINYLTGLVTDCIASRAERGILIFQDGRVAEYNGEVLRTHRSYKVDITEPHIYLSIRYYLREFIESEQLSTIFLPQVLNENERKVLSEMKNRNVKHVSIVLNEGNVKKISSTKEGILTGQQAKQIKEILGLTNYQQIILDTLDESTFKIKKTDKKV